MTPNIWISVCGFCMYLVGYLYGTDNISFVATCILVLMLGWQLHNNIDKIKGD